MLILTQTILELEFDALFVVGRNARWKNAASCESGFVLASMNSNFSQQASVFEYFDSCLKTKLMLF